MDDLTQIQKIVDAVDAESSGADYVREKTAGAEEGASPRSSRGFSASRASLGGEAASTGGVEGESMSEMMPTLPPSTETIGSMPSDTVYRDFLFSRCIGASTRWHGPVGGRLGITKDEEEVFAESSDYLPGIISRRLQYLIVLFIACFLFFVGLFLSADSPVKLSFRSTVFSMVYFLVFEFGLLACLLIFSKFNTSIDSRIATEPICCSHRVAQSPMPFLRSLELVGGFTSPVTMVSYHWSERSQRFARTLAYAIHKSHGWIDVNKLPLGCDIEGEVSAVVKRAASLVLFVTVGYLRSPNCLTELIAACSMREDPELPVFLHIDEPLGEEVDELLCNLAASHNFYVTRSRSELVDSICGHLIDPKEEREQRAIMRWWRRGRHRLGEHLVQLQYGSEVHHVAAPSYVRDKRSTVTECWSRRSRPEERAPDVKTDVVLAYDWVARDLSATGTTTPWLEAFSYPIIMVVLATLFITFVWATSKHSHLVRNLVFTGLSLFMFAVQVSFLFYVPNMRCRYNAPVLTPLFLASSVPTTEPVKITFRCAEDAQKETVAAFHRFCSFLQAAGIYCDLERSITPDPVSPPPFDPGEIVVFVVDSETSARMYLNTQAFRNVDSHFVCVDPSRMSPKTQSAIRKCLYIDFSIDKSTGGLKSTFDEEEGIVGEILRSIAHRIPIAVRKAPLLISSPRTIGSSRSHRTQSAMPMFPCSTEVELGHSDSKSVLNPLEREPDV